MLRARLGPHKNARTRLALAVVWIRRPWAPSASQPWLPPVHKKVRVGHDQIVLLRLVC